MKLLDRWCALCEKLPPWLAWLLIVLVCLAIVGLLTMPNPFDVIFGK